ncbi:MAG: D-alanyl-D-alanine dipeptidase [Candidatus Acidoferrum typicum]|nr:D-alanyl-D-alanine dipeptidase [Candidatus Acidoferrum typicum]
MLRIERCRSTIWPPPLSFSFRLLSICLFAARCFAQVAPFSFPGAKPADIPQAWKRLVGEYGPEQTSLIVLEKSGKLILREKDSSEIGLQPAPGGNFTLDKPPASPLHVRFGEVAKDRANSLSLGDVSFPRRQLGPEEGQVFRIQPSRSIDDLRKEALAVSPPHEQGHFRAPDLVDLAALDPTIHLDIRYATSNDFLGTPVYTQARALLQRPAAEALVRALLRVKPFSYGLLIHDAYRPWYVTKIFWDATPPEGKIFVADPAQGSRHNRGCAVDLTLYELQTGKPIQMPGTYDEMSPRSFPDYPGGTSLQRWHRDLLRWAMESEGFSVYEHEWWHFDYKDWREYPILNVPFEKLQFSEKQVR